MNCTYFFLSGPVVFQDCFYILMLITNTLVTLGDKSIIYVILECLSMSQIKQIYLGAILVGDHERFSRRNRKFYCIFHCFLFFPQVSPSAASGELSEKDVFPNFFRTVPALSATNRTFITIAKMFHWSRIAILYQSRELFASVSHC